MGDEEEDEAEAKYSSFIVKETGAKCEVLYIPTDVRVNSAKLQSIVLDHWKLELPTTMIKCDAGTVHPKSFATPKLCTLKTVTGREPFKVFWEDALHHAKIAGCKEGDEQIQFAEDIIVRTVPSLGGISKPPTHSSPRSI